LVEFLVVAVVLIIVGLAAVILMETGRSSWVLTDTQLQTQTEAQRVMDRIGEDARKARASNVTCTGGGAGVQIIPEPEHGGPITYAVTETLSPPGLPDTNTLTRSQGGAEVVIATRLVEFSCVKASAEAQVIQLRVTARSRTPNQRLLDQTVTTDIWMEVP
jgi:hypothetical protein